MAARSGSKDEKDAGSQIDLPAPRNSALEQCTMCCRSLHPWARSLATGVEIDMTCNSPVNVDVEPIPDCSHSTSSKKGPFDSRASETPKSGRCRDSENYLESLKKTSRISAPIFSPMARSHGSVKQTCEEESALRSRSREYHERIAKYCLKSPSPSSDLHEPTTDRRTFRITSECSDGKRNDKVAEC